MKTLSLIPIILHRWWCQREWKRSITLCLKLCIHFYYMHIWRKWIIKLRQCGRDLSRSCNTTNCVTFFNLNSMRLMDKIDVLYASKKNTRTAWAVNREKIGPRKSVVSVFESLAPESSRVILDDLLSLNANLPLFSKSNTFFSYFSDDFRLKIFMHYS